MTAPARITVFTSARAPLCKRFALQDGKINKTTLATLYEGQANVTPAPTAAALNAQLESLTHTQAVATGVLKRGATAEITTAAKAGAGKAVRGLKDFAFPKGQGWLLWDYDAKSMPPEVAARVNELGGPLAAFFHIWPEAKKAAHVIRPSSSDGINAPGIDAIRNDGLHGFFLVQDVAQSKSILETLEARAWNEGLAWIALSASGAALQRSIVDTAVGSPERLIFEAPPILDAPITRQPRPAIVSEGEAIAAPALPLEIAASARDTQDAAREAIKPKAAKVQSAFIDTRAAIEAQKTGKTFAAARASIMQMMQGATLADDHLLQMKSGAWVSVATLLDAGDKYDRLSMPDPVEGLEYGGDKATLLIRPRPGNPAEKPRLVSHAHGIRTVYKFARFEPLPQPPFHPGPKGDRGANIRATGDAIEAFFAAVVPPLRASRAVKELYADIDSFDPDKSRRRKEARLSVQRAMGLDYTPGKRPRIPDADRKALVSGAQGVGKSAALVGDLHKAILSGRGGRIGALHGTLGIVSLILAPDHDKADELQADYEANRTPDSPPSFRIRGRSQLDPETGKTLCWIPKAAERIAKKGGNVRQALCHTCPFAEHCGYRAQEAELSGLAQAGEGVAIFGPKEYGFIPLPGTPPIDLVVIDEALRGLGAVHHEIGLEELGTPLQAEDTGRAQTFLGKTGEAADAAAANLQFIQPVRVALRDGFRDNPDRPYTILQERGLTIETVQEAIAGLQFFEEKELERRVAAAISEWKFAEIAGGKGKSLEAAIEAAIESQDAKQTAKVKALFSAVAKDLAKGHDAPTAAWRGWYKGKRRDWISTADLQQLHFSKDTPLLHMDGTADPELTRLIFGDMTHHHFPVERRAAVTQVTGHSFSIGQLTGTNRAGKPLSGKTLGEAAALRRQIIDLVARQPSPLTVASARVEAALVEDGISGETAHYQALRGRNDWEECETIIAAGPEIKPPFAVEAIARAYAANDPDAAPFQSIGESKWPKEARALRMADNTTSHMIEVVCHPDPWAERVLRQMVDAEILQALDRIRLIHNADPKRVIVLAPVVLDLTVNEVVPWSEMKAGGDRVERARDSAGVLPLSKHAACKLLPDLWKSSGTAQRDVSVVDELVKSLMDQNPNNILLFGKWSVKSARLCEYQETLKPGQKRARRHRALIWADTPEDARSKLEALTGPLREFSEVLGWIEARDAAQDELDALQERAAIAEFEGGETRSDAERIAQGKMPRPKRQEPTQAPTPEFAVPELHRITGTGPP